MNKTILVHQTILNHHCCQIINITIVNVIIAALIVDVIITILGSVVLCQGSWRERVKDNSGSSDHPELWLVSDNFDAD